MGSVPATLQTAQANESLKTLNVKFKLRTTNQSPFGMIVARERFEDGSKCRATRIRWAEPGALKRLYQLALDLDKAEKPLDFLQVTAMNDDPPSEFTGWSALVLHLQAHLEKKGISWKDQDYGRHMRQLGAFKGPVTAQKLQSWVEACPTDDRDYDRRLTTLKKLMTCCPNIEISSQWLTKAKDERSYNPHLEVNPRTIPSDRFIELFIDSFPAKKWRQYFGLIAVYGMRTHEPFTVVCPPDEQGFIEINSLKTGYRAIAPRNYDWLDRWDLRNLDLPKANPNHSTGKQLGNRASTKWYRHKLMHPELLWRPDAQCYDLRHAFAGAFHETDRFSHITVDELCILMGHTKKVHEKHYKRWLDKKKLKAQAARRFRNR